MSTNHALLAAWKIKKVWKKGIYIVPKKSNRHGFILPLYITSELHIPEPLGISSIGFICFFTAPNWPILKSLVFAVILLCKKKQPKCPVVEKPGFINKQTSITSLANFGDLLDENQFIPLLYLIGQKLNGVLVRFEDHGKNQHRI